MPAFTEKSVLEDSTIEKRFEKTWGLETFDKYELNISFPQLAEQLRIPENLSVADRKLELELRRKRKLERGKKGLMNEPLTGRKRVKV
jgi:type I restriction enzyme S subunit